MSDYEDSISAWIGKEILPHEGGVRKWLARRWPTIIDPNDVIQEAYCRIANLSSVSHIHNPAAYFYRTAYSVATDMMRRNGIINFTTMTENEWSNVIDDRPLADRTIVSEQELRRVTHLLSELSDTCREAIELRRIEGMSQKEAARQLGISEDAIRNHLVRGIQKVLKIMTAQDGEVSQSGPKNIEQKVDIGG